MPRRVFYGWWIAAVSALSLSLSIGTLAVYSFSLFVKPLSQEFGWSRGEISLAMTLTSIAVSLMSPLLGRLADRFSSRAVLLPAHLCLGLALASFYFSRPTCGICTRSTLASAYWARARRRWLMRGWWLNGSTLAVDWR